MWLFSFIFNWTEQTLALLSLSNVSRIARPATYVTQSMSVPSGLRSAARPFSQNKFISKVSGSGSPGYCDSYNAMEVSLSIVGIFSLILHLDRLMLSKCVYVCVCLYHWLYRKCKIVLLLPIGLWCTVLKPRVWHFGWCQIVFMETEETIFGWKGGAGEDERCYKWLCNAWQTASGYCYSSHLKL